MSFQDKTVVITGAAGGIGLGLSRQFGKAGAKVALVDMNGERLARASELLQSEGLNARPFVADVSDATSVESMVAQVGAAFGSIDILCCNAAIFTISTIEETTPEMWDRVMAVNTKGAFLCVKAALPGLRKSSAGRVILTSSITGPITGIPSFAHYAASKAGMLGFMRGAVIELARDGITVNAILPGVIETEALSVLGDDFIANARKLVPVHRLGTPNDIANAAMFFAHPDSGFVTGQALVVDGGQILPETPDSVLPPRT
jgi:3-oxoacyl-[acyl-carrier protein] reductase